MENVIYELPPYCMDLIKEVKEKTGYSLQIFEKPFLEFDSELKLASRSRSGHCLEYLPIYRKHRDHFIVNSAYKILRVWAVPREDRFMPASELGRKLPEQEHRELAQKMGLKIGDEFVQSVSCFLFGSLARQLTSFPVDLRVEREIAQSLPEHKTKQLSYLETQVQDFLPTLDEQMLSMFPEHVFRVSTAMNIAFAEQAAELAGVATDSLFREHSSRSLAEQLLHQLCVITDPGYRGDCTLTDAWARELGLEGWYKWVRYDEI